MDKIDKLELSIETIRELTKEEMTQVAAGAQANAYTGYYPTINYPCISNKVCVG